MLKQICKLHKSCKGRATRAVFHWKLTVTKMNGGTICKVIDVNSYKYLVEIIVGYLANAFQLPSYSIIMEKRILCNYNRNIWIIITWLGTQEWAINRKFVLTLINNLMRNSATFQIQFYIEISYIHNFSNFIGYKK